MDKNNEKYISLNNIGVGPKGVPQEFLNNKFILLDGFEGFHKITLAYLQLNLWNKIYFMGDISAIKILKSMRNFLHFTSLYMKHLIDSQTYLLMGII